MIPIIKSEVLQFLNFFSFKFEAEISKPIVLYFFMNQELNKKNNPNKKSALVVAGRQLSISKPKISLQPDIVILLIIIPKIKNTKK